jgi:hypothetical protein
MSENHAVFRTYLLQALEILQKKKKAAPVPAL